MPRLALLLLCIATPAFAQVPIDEFHPAVDSRGYLTLNGSSVLDHGDLSFGLGSLAWGRHLLALPDGTSIDHVVSATLVGAVGVRLGLPLELGVSMPFTIVKGTTDGQGVGDLGLHAKARLLHAGPLGLAAIASLYLPTATPRGSMLGEASTTPELVGVADVALGRVRLAINGGIRIRPTETLMTMVEASTELPVGGAVAYALAPQRFEIVGEVFGAIPVGAHHGYQPLEALAGVKLYLATNSYLSLGAGRGLVPDQAGNPDMRAFIGMVFEPKPAERRAAHVPDAPPEPPPPPPPTPDNDPVPPDSPPVIDVGSELEILQPIEFEFDKAILRPSAAPILDAVVHMMSNNPAIQVVEVQGHTDEQGDDAYNMELSNRRAAAVVDYLVAHGIAGTRLRSRGYGETVPLDHAHTQAAYTKNRRVEFHVLERSDM